MLRNGSNFGPFRAAITSIDQRMMHARTLRDIRVEATRGFIADKWKIEWGNKEALISEFKKRRDAYLDKASKTIDTEGELKIYVMH
jgi:hypothetical protein